MSQITTDTQKTLIDAIIAFEADLKIVAISKRAEGEAAFREMVEAHDRVRESSLSRLLPTTYRNAVMWMYEDLREVDRDENGMEIDDLGAQK